MGSEHPALTGVLSCGGVGTQGPRTGTSPSCHPEAAPHSLKRGSPGTRARLAGGTARGLTWGGGPPSATSCGPASRRRRGCQIAAPAALAPRPTRRQEPGPERGAGLTSPPPRCRLPSVLLGPPRPRREPAPGAEGAGPRACGPLIGPARGHSEAPPGLPHSWRSPAELEVGVGGKRGRLACGPSAEKGRRRAVGSGRRSSRSRSGAHPENCLGFADGVDTAGGEPCG